MRSTNTPLFLALLLGLALSAAGWGRAAAEEKSPIKHVFVIVLENEGYDTTFGPGSKAPYLSTVLPTIFG